MMKDYADEEEQFLFSQPTGSFLQSDMWSRVKNGWISERIIVRRNGKIAASMLVLIKRIPQLRTALMYAPRGPVCSFDDMEVLNELMDELSALQKKYRAFMLKIDPLFEQDNHVGIENLKSLGFTHAESRVGYDNVQCREHYIIELAGRTVEDVYGCISAKYRYKIRVAKRHGVRCEVCGKDKLDDFYRLLEETAERDHFLIRDKPYYERMLDQLGDHCRLYMCYLGDEPLSGAITVNYAGNTHYEYGASTARHRECMPNYLMQWEMIQWAVETGCTVYSFGGIPYYYDETHPNYGVYYFKKGFGGRVSVLAGEFDYTYKPVTRRLVNIVLRLLGRRIAL